MSFTMHRPSLQDWTGVAGDVADELASTTGELRAALVDLRTAPGTFEFLADVPPLEVDLLAHGDRVGAVAGAVTALVAAITDVDENGMGSLDVSDLGDFRDALPAPIEARVFVDDDGRLVVDGSGQSEHVQIIDNGNGTFTVRVGTLVGSGASATVDYTEHTVTADPDQIVVRAAGGDDVIEYPAGSDVSVVVSGGDGDDLVGAGRGGDIPLGGGAGDDQLFGGDGNDVLLGGAGADLILGGAGKDSMQGQGGSDMLVGGDDYDVAYGGRGDDELHGGGGDDSLEGGSGDDTVRGGEGGDLVSGGGGDDNLDGGAGDDHLFAGEDGDEVTGGAGYDRATVQDGDTTDTARRIVVEIDPDRGSYAIITGDRPPEISEEDWAAWQERLSSDLDLIRQTGAGQVGLAALDDASRDSDSGWSPFDSDHRIVVRPYAEPGAGPDQLDVSAHLDGRNALSGSTAYSPGGEDNASVRYNTHRPSALDDRPPVNSVYHELSHSFDQISGGTNPGHYTEVTVDASGTEVARREPAYDAAGNEVNGAPPMAEVNSVGHDIDGDGDIDTQPSAGGREHPSELTENALREDLGIDERPSYTVRPADIPADGEVRYEDVDPEP